jgi:hypothetical protein
LFVICTGVSADDAERNGKPVTSAPSTPDADADIGLGTFAA